MVEHIGSTSVPGLAAKPIIDICVVVADSSDESSYVPALQAESFELRVREPDWHEHRMLRTPTRDVHVHVFTEGSTEIRRHLVFRDHLRKKRSGPSAVRGDQTRARHPRLANHAALCRREERGRGGDPLPRTPGRRTRLTHHHRSQFRR
jgi:GrpB-like predicted nucleotidyltransferase (UPF0157 family)